MKFNPLWLGLAVMLSALFVYRANGDSPLPGGKRSQRYALLIGVNDYAPPLGKLEYCHHDMTELRAHLEAAGFPPANITYMHDQAQTPRMRPSKANLEGELRLRLQLANPDDIVLVAFSGHGLQIDGQSYLCPSDARLDSTSSMLAIDDLYAQLEKCRASQKVLVVDACRNEPIVRGFKSGKLAEDLKIQVQAPPKGLLVLSSCEAGQFSAEDPKLKHGVFMHYFMQGLKGEADTDEDLNGNRNGRIDLVELYFYAHEKTKRHVAESHGIIQRPVLKGEIIGRFDVAFVPDAARRLKLSQRDLTAEGGDRLSLEHPLVRQGDASLAAGAYDAAIGAYAAALADPAIGGEARTKAYKGRGAAYSGRADQGDLTKALSDYHAAGLAGMTVKVRVAAANLQIGDQVRATVQKNQSLLVTKIENGWLWVESVNGNSQFQGFTQPSAVQPQAAVTVQQFVPAQQYVYQQYEGNTSWNNQQNFSNSRSSNQRNNGGRPPSIWETREWETPRQIQERRRNGTLR